MVYLVDGVTELVSLLISCDPAYFNSDLQVIETIILYLVQLTLLQR